MNSARKLKREQIKSASRMLHDFSTCLRMLMEDTGLFTLEQWTVLLGLKPTPTSGPTSFSPVERIELWFDELELPRPHVLHLIVTFVKDHSGVPPEPMELFEEMSHRRATEVSSMGVFMLPTVHEYYTRPLFSPIGSKLAKMNLTEQKQFLLETYPCP